MTAVALSVAVQAAGSSPLSSREDSSAGRKVYHQDRRGIQSNLKRDNDVIVASWEYAGLEVKCVQITVVILSSNEREIARGETLWEQIRPAGSIATRILLNDT